MPAEVRGRSLGAGHSGAGDPHWQGIHPAHLFIVERLRVPQIADEHLESILSPE